MFIVLTCLIKVWCEGVGQGAGQGASSRSGISRQLRDRQVKLSSLGCGVVGVWSDSSRIDVVGREGGRGAEINTTQYTMRTRCTPGCS